MRLYPYFGSSSVIVNALLMRKVYIGHCWIYDFCQVYIIGYISILDFWNYSSEWL